MAREGGARLDRPVRTLDAVGERLAMHRAHLKTSWARLGAALGWVLGGGVVVVVGGGDGWWWWSVVVVCVVVVVGGVLGASRWHLGFVLGWRHVDILLTHDKPWGGHTYPAAI